MVQSSKHVLEYEYAVIHRIKQNRFSDALSECTQISFSLCIIILSFLTKSFNYEIP